uniref:Putative secreted protein n=1 Tax=Panstrongylus lignarius TaxID=156445 RepID=A0A224Y3D1_9HEMI
MLLLAGKPNLYFLFSITTAAPQPCWSFDPSVYSIFVGLIRAIIPKKCCTNTVTGVIFFGYFNSVWSTDIGGVNQGAVACN